MGTIQTYNAAFFGYVQNMFLEIQKDLGTEKALEFTRRTLETGLKNAYDGMGFERGDVEDFRRVLTERDNSVGLRVEFPLVKDDEVVYQFLDDPFPILGVHADRPEPEQMDGTYMLFKVDYLLGDGWEYDTTSHLWRGDDRTEHVITRK